MVPCGTIKDLTSSAVCVVSPLVPKCRAMCFSSCWIRARCYNYDAVFRRYNTAAVSSLFWSGDARDTGWCGRAMIASRPTETDTLACSCGVFQSNPFLMIKPLYERHKGQGNELHPDIYEGYVVDLAEIISKRLNIKFEIQIVKDGKYGSKDESGNWNGMVNELLLKVTLLSAHAMNVHYIQFRLYVINFN